METGDTIGGDLHGIFLWWNRAHCRRKVRPGESREM